MDRVRDEFIHRCNVSNYKRMLRVAPDAANRKVLTTLLAEERANAKLNGWLPMSD